ncbi:hypothetical protein [Sulfurovum lithotrophicum]|uniref:hypothetical protein n=1 Tax=Sulfurovum lithotrophicum TaxID=206403 RepID=UPI000B0D63E3|nr:hypothetical protein [Sulfurovum lithotrophicum]
MKCHRFSLAAVVTITLFSLLGSSVSCLGSRVDSRHEADRTNFSSSVLPGSPVRKTILDALRKKMKELQGTEMVFIVKYMKVKNGWSWVHTIPQSRDGKSHYEDISALMYRKDGIWKVAELAYTEEENPECIGDPSYFTKLKERFPKVPAEILPGK